MIYVGIGCNVWNMDTIRLGTTPQGPHLGLDPHEAQYSFYTSEVQDFEKSARPAQGQ